MYNFEMISVVYFYFNYKDVIGFGEVNVVLNGVEFWIWYNDYFLVMFNYYFNGYYVIEKILYL